MSEIVVKEEMEGVMYVVHCNRGTLLFTAAKWTPNNYQNNI